MRRRELLTAAGLSIGLPSSASADTIDPNERPLITDEAGRTIHPRGVNVVYKRDPYYPPRNEFGPKDCERIADWGFTFVRLGILWAGLEPERGQLNRAYLERIREIVRQCADAGLVVLLDMHQDLYSHVLGGDGAPEWAVYTGGSLEHYDHDAVRRWEINYIKPAVATAFDNFWLNRDGIQDRFAATWQAVAEALGDEPNVVGYEPLNEPMFGYRTFPWFERLHLSRMYERVIAAIRAVDDETPIWLEPLSLFNQGVDTHLPPIDDPADALVFSYHNYAGIVNELLGDGIPWGPIDPGRADDRLVMHNGASAAAERRWPGVMTEFSHGDGRTLASVLRDAEAQGHGWCWWPYKESTLGWTSPAEAPVGQHGLASGSDEATLDRLIRPVPQALAGDLETLRFDRLGRECYLAFTAQSADGPSRLFVPERHFPAPDITIDRGRIASWDGEQIELEHPSSGSVMVQITNRSVATIRTMSGQALVGSAGVSLEDDPAPGTHWEFQPVGAPGEWGSYRLVAAAGALVADGDALTLGEPSGARARWELRPVEADQYYVRNAATGATLVAADQGPTLAAPSLLQPLIRRAPATWQIDLVA